jgi:CubicO group peptidase (beta-lactamase class C family)
MPKLSGLRNARRALAAVIASMAVLLVTAQSSGQVLPESKAPTTTKAVPSATVARPAASDEAIAAFIDGYISEEMDRGGIPGAAVVVVKDGRTILSKGYGYADIASRRPVTVEDTLFRQASLAKPFVWILAMQLAEEGRLDLDRDVNSYLDFKIPGGFDRPITMRHLMTHSAGFADRFWGIFGPDVSTPLGQVLRRNIPARVYAPGTTVSYSNYGSALAGHIVARIAGKPFDRLVEERIFVPVGMKRSTFAQPLPSHLRPLLVSGYTAGSREPFHFENFTAAPAAALSASAGDMGRFLTALLANGQAPGGKLVAPATLQRMFLLNQRLAPGFDEGLGLGFVVGNRRGVRYVRHAGNLTTTSTDLQLLPDENFGWYIGFNGDGVGGAAGELQENLFSAIVARFFAPDRPVVRPYGPSSAEEVAGDYVTTRRVRSGPLLFRALLGLTTVTAGEDGTLRISSARSADGALRRWLPAGRDRFVDEETGISLGVTRDREGRVARLGSALLNPVAELERSPAFWSSAERLFRLSFMVLLFAALAQPIGWALRRGYKAAPSGPSSGAARITKPLGRAAVWLILGTAAYAVTFLSKVPADKDLMFNGHIPRALIPSLALLSSLFAAIIIADAALAWRDPARGWPRRLGLIAVAGASVVMCWLFYSFGLTSFSTDY